MKHLKQIKYKFLRHLSSVPFIYALIFPLIFLDLVKEIYHSICFPLYGLQKNKRSEYIRIDRHKLSYLNPFQKINCAYCGYANGLLNYAVKIAGDTEHYWCGIQHMKEDGFKEPKHHQDFLEYGNHEQLKEQLK